MALDQIPREEEYRGFKVCHNIRNAFFKIERYCDTIQSYESSMSYSPYKENGANALLCYVVLEDAEKVSYVLQKLCHCH